jgi:hypothetical protein
MDKKIAGLLGAVGALASLDAAQATPSIDNPTETLTARSYADLIEPIPNAAATLRAIDANRGLRAGDVQVAQYYDHHHHHHHNSYYGRYRASRVVVIPRYERRYHHHHHHHSFYRRYRDDD